MSIWPQRGIGCAFSIQRSICPSSYFLPSQANAAQSFLRSIHTSAETSKRFYASDEKHREKLKNDLEKKDDFCSARYTANQTESSTFVHQNTKPQSLQFFSPRLDKTIDEEALKNLLNHCDRAIILSRDSSETETFWTAKDHLFQATRIYVDLVKRSSLKSDIDVLSYETYLIRSGYAHVIRTIGALIGRDGLIVCARMMQDFLRWELDLLKMKFESGNGSEEWHRKRIKKRKEEESAKQKSFNQDEKEAMFIEDSVLSSGPFLQDLAPIYYDIVNDLTSEEINQDVLSRKFTSKEHEAIATELRLLVRQIPYTSWIHPLSLDWNRFRTSLSESFNNGSSVINASIRMMAQAYAKSTRTSSTLHLLLDEMNYWKSPNEHTARLQQIVSKTFRHQVRATSKILINKDDVEAATVKGKLEELLEMFNRIFSIVSRNRRKDSFTPKLIWDTQDFTSNLRCLINSIRLFEDPTSLHHFYPEQEEKAKRLSFEFRSWLERCIDLNEQVHLLDKLGIHTFNMILQRFMVSSPLFGEASVEMASKLIDYMLTSNNAPRPDEVTLTILIGNSAKLGNAKMLRSAILAAHLSLRKGFRDKFDGKREYPNSVMYSLLQHAVNTNYRARIIALLDAAKFALLYHSRIGNESVSLDVAFISAKKAIMLLYPSLQIDRPRYPIRRVRIRNLKARKKREKKFESRYDNSQVINSTFKKTFKGSENVEESHIQAQFHPSVLVAALRLTVGQLKTGLAERLWRLWLRVKRRQGYIQGNTTNYDTIRALTILNQLYAIEVKRDCTIIARLKAYNSMTDASSSSVGPRIYGTKKRYNHTIRLRSKMNVLGWAYELGRNSNIDPQMTKINDRTLMARKIARLRYFQLREIWSPNQENDHPRENVNLTNVSRIQISQVLPSNRPDNQFYSNLLSVFRKKGRKRLPFDPILLQQDDSFSDFFRLIEFDMKTFGLEVPLDFRIWISELDRSPEKRL